MSEKLGLTKKNTRKIGFKIKNNKLINKSPNKSKSLGSLTKVWVHQEIPFDDGCVRELES